MHKLSTEIIRENQTIILEVRHVSGMVKKSEIIQSYFWNTDGGHSEHF